ncbi:CapA domain protein [Natrialba magadii ATCC 43099]|uniref:CapA domain protein n=1 Tax=Natrialba magadii (strain ATCC 43099 / DSM 3394 / CCM 3739 / CIP 104546 / IAM 13178 / JCM 8861 / NBRC 102185 / NCIMB 2190 / MS3) TaxID=547559 RepID=D3STS0_NATMM|nr:CapA family protein [Natrialba magadii]ADD05087.1 CapA domain protein [Natrialba magadii ATCC 43099]ELY23322.1 capsule synthesis protein, CapA [Natrialba magadii ATCC 43099]
MGQQSPTRIGFTGDVMLGRLVDTRQRTRRRAPDAVWGSVSDQLRELDGLVINLECCLSTRGRQWQRTYRPFHFRADPDWAIPALESVGVDVCALANNHVLDYETIALRDTLATLDEAGIAHAGAGETIDEALEPAVRSIGDCEIAVVSFTDNTPEYAADEETPGTAWIEIDVGDEETKRRVREALDRARRSNPDLLVASLHWGPNMVTEPSASFREFGRWLVEEGVDLVHGHSAHVFHGIELHDGRPIVYDAGDFVDDYAVDPELQNDRSFLFVLSVTDVGEPVELRLVPTEISECTVSTASAEAATWARQRMRSLSARYGTTFEQDGADLVLELDTG